MRLILTLLAALALAAPAAAADPEEAAIVAQVERFFDAMRAADVAALQALVLEETRFTSSRVRPGGSDMRRIPTHGWAESLRGGPTIDERMWDPKVMRRGPMAVVWAPYELKVDGKTTHCGIDVFDMVKVEGTWRIAHLMWTQEPEACAELKARKPG